LPKRATEKDYQPISKEKWDKIKKGIYNKIGK